MKKTVLLSENEIGTRKILTSVLNAADFSVLHAADEGEVITLAANYVPDFLILNVDVASVRNVIASIREWCDAPIIAISDSEREADKIEVLDSGADDYMVKPIGRGELLARMRAIVRRNKISVDDGVRKMKNYHSGEVDIDFEQYRVLVRGENVHLTNNEYKIIMLLAKYSGRILSYDYILKKVWGPFAKEGNNALRVNMANIRKKIEKNPSEPEYLVTVQGVGYGIREAE